jgi:hypothetical protein
VFADGVPLSLIRNNNTMAHRDEADLPKSRGSM